MIGQNYQKKKKRSWALFAWEFAQRYKEVEKITLVMANLSTHKAGSLYETFSPEEAKVLWD